MSLRLPSDKSSNEPDPGNPNDPTVKIRIRASQHTGLDTLRATGIPGGASKETPVPVPETGLAEIVFLGEGRYVLEALIGRGGGGLVYRARDLHLDRPVAIKILLAEFRDNPDEIERFRREARLTSGLCHPGIPPLFDFGMTSDGRPFMVMKLIEGTTLSERHPENPAELTTWLPIFEQACLAVAFAHSRGIIHRDLKPQNIMVGPFGDVQVVDWGLAKSISITDDESRVLPRTDSELTQVGLVIGTPAYLAPEQARGRRADFRSDVFGLGAILCEILTGSAPFRASDSNRSITLAISGDLEHTFTRLARLPIDRGLIDLCRDCLALIPLQRPKNAVEVADRVAALRQQAEARASEADVGRRLAELRVLDERRRRRLQVAVLVCAFGLVVSFGVMLHLKRGRHDERMQQQIRRDDVRRQQRDQLEQSLAGIRERIREVRIRGQVESILNDATLIAERAESYREHFLSAEARKLVDELRFLIRLHRIRLNKSTLTDSDEPWNAVVSAREYAMAFAEVGIDPTKDPTESVGRINASTIREELIAAFDDWGMDEPDPVLRRSVWMLTKAVTGQAWRETMIDATTPERITKALEGIPKEDRSLPILTAMAAALARNNSKSSVELLSAACRKYPSDFWLLVALGNALYETETRDETESAGCFRAALALRPDCAPVWGRLGETLYEKGDFVEAEACFRRALSIEPDSVTLRINLAKVYRESNRIDEALTQLKESLQFDPKSSRSYAHLAATYRILGRLDDALAAARRSVEYNPTGPRPYFYLAWILKDRGELNEVAETFRTAVKFGPNSAGLRMDLGYALRELGQFDEAIAAFREGLRLRPSSRTNEYQIEQTTRLRDMARDIADVAAGRKKLEATRDLVEYAGLASSPWQSRYGLAVDLYERVDAIDSERLSQSAIRAAASAVCLAEGRDPTRQPDSKEQARLRNLARKWLQIHVNQNRRRALGTNLYLRRSARENLSQPLTEHDLKGVRDPDRLAKLPAAERVAWEQFWSQTRQLIDDSLKLQSQPPEL